MKIVIASDSFKGSMTASQIGETIKKGLLKYSEDFEVYNIPMADGGEGTVDSLVASTGGHLEHSKVYDPLMREIDGYYGILGDGETAVIEMAVASGLPLLKREEYNPLITNTFGTGQLIKDALDHGCRNFLIGIGGSATNDGGMGMLRALGVKFYDSDHQELTGGGADLLKLKSIDVKDLDKRILESKFEVASDVQNPLCGKDGASFVYGAQKGATKEMIELLDSALNNYADCILTDLNKDIKNVKGAGAAGGLGAALIAFLNADLKKGIDIVIELSHLEDEIKDANLVITGEGNIDSQTRFGKTPYGVAKLSKKYNIPVLAICGGIGEGSEILYEHGFDAIFSIVDKPMNVDEAMTNCGELLERITYNVIKLYMLKDEVNK